MAVWSWQDKMEERKDRRQPTGRTWEWEVEAMDIASFDDVADWCEKHLEEKRGREIGMTFGAMIRAYGRLATLPSRLHGEQRAFKERALNKRAEELLMELSTRFFVAYEATKTKIVEPEFVRTNMTYDTGPRGKE